MFSEEGDANIDSLVMDPALHVTLFLFQAKSPAAKINTKVPRLWSIHQAISKIKRAWASVPSIQNQINFARHHKHHQKFNQIKSFETQ